MPRQRNTGGGQGTRRRQGPSDYEPRRSSSVAVNDAPVGPVELPATLTVGSLAEILKKSNVDTIKALMRLGVMATVNETIEFDVAARVAASFEIPVLKPREREESAAASRVGIDETMTAENSLPRPPIITVLGHVDHGKTTLLDAIRGAKVVDTEAGGITQSIGAYQVERNGLPITFIDTPGHEAFTSMRASGAQVTDIAVLVVAADDGVMPQTIEAIDHAKAAGVPIVVAVNKMDAPGADPDRVKGELAEHEIIVEDYGGDVICVPVSALKKEGIDDLLESLLLVAEVQELRANPNRSGIGVVIEAHTDRVRGSIATVLVRAGTVRIGDNVVAGTQRGRVRAMLDGFGRQIDSAGPSTPVQIMGLGGLPGVGDQLDVVEDERAARTLVETRERLQAGREEHAASTMADVMRRVHSGEAKVLNVVVKAGTQGSVDAVRRAVSQLATEEVQINIIHASAGQIGEADILLASASDALVVGFETNAEANALGQATMRGVVVKTYDIIYNLVDDVRSAVEGLIEPEERQVVIGHANVLEVFARGKREKIAGVRVTDGTLRRTARMRVIRKGNQIFDGAVASMRHLQENVREIANNFEGGVILDGFHDYEPGDVLEAYEIRTS